MLSNMKIGTRLAFSFGLMLLLMVAVIVIGLKEMQVINKELDTIVKIENVRTQIANTLIDQARESAVLVRGTLLMIYSKQPIKRIEDNMVKYRNNRIEYNENAEKMKSLFEKNDYESINMFKKVEESGRIAQENKEKVIQLALSGKVDDATKLLFGTAYPSVQQSIKDLKEQIELENEHMRERFSIAQATYSSVRMYMFTAGFIAVVLGLVLSIFLTTSITKPLNLSIQAANRIVSKDLTVDLSTHKKRGDEVGVMIQSFSRMVDTLRDHLQEIRESANVLSSSCTEILAATTQVASGSMESATAISETTTTVEEVRQAAQLSSQKAKNVSDSAVRVAQTSQAGRKSVDETIAGMNNIRTQMESVANTIVSLSEQSQSIGGIIASVTDIADQTNLLAVNAAIEAARAGEQGKGFAVVAQEIRSLAEQSKQATMQVRGILNDIQKATSAAVMATEQGTKAVEAGVKQSAQTGDSIRMLAETIDEAMKATTQIVASSQQQVVGMDQIGVAMENINQAGAETATSMRQSETAVRNLHDLGQKLKGLAEQFKV